jgi:hypothetical protein
MTDWTLDPLARARGLDGDLPPAERERCERDLAADPAGRARVERDAAVVRALRAAAAVRPPVPAGLEGRVCAALRADRARTGRVLVFRRFAPAAMLAAAAAVLVWATVGRVQESHAAPREVLLAAEAFHQAELGLMPRGGAVGSCEEGAASPHRFPLVTNGEASVESCEPREAETVSVLRGEDDRKALRGLVAVPWDGKSSATDVGWTRVGDLVVFDVAIGRAKYYLATRSSAVEGRPACAACHGPLRAGNPSRNPHRFVERTAVDPEAWK